MALEVLTPQGKRRPFAMVMEAVLARTGYKRPGESIIEWRSRVKQATDELLLEIDANDEP